MDKPSENEESIKVLMDSSFQYRFDLYKSSDAFDVLEWLPIYKNGYSVSFYLLLNIG